MSFNADELMQLEPSPQAEPPVPSAGGDAIQCIGKTAAGARCRKAAALFGTSCVQHERPDEKDRRAVWRTAAEKWGRRSDAEFTRLRRQLHESREIIRQARDVLEETRVRLTELEKTKETSSMTTEGKAKLFTDRVQKAVEEIQKELHIDPTEITIDLRVSVQTHHEVRISKDPRE